MAAAATMAAAARELVLRAGASDMEEEEGPLVRTQGFFSSGVAFGRARVQKARAGFRFGWEIGGGQRGAPQPSLESDPSLSRGQSGRLQFPGHSSNEPPDLGAEWGGSAL